MLLKIATKIFKMAAKCTNGRHIQPITGLMSVLWLCLWSKYQLIFIDYYILTIFELQFEIKQLKKIQNGG